MVEIFFQLGAAVVGLKDVGHGAAVLGALGPELVVRGDVIAVGQDGEAGRADVNARGGRAVVDDHARHGFWVSTADGTRQAGQRQHG